MPKDWGGKPNCAPRSERPPEEPQETPAEDDGVCPACDGTGEQHRQLCKACGGKGYL
jgi:hypothetical protein